MWEAIARNRRRSWLLVSLMGVILVALGAAIGGSLEPEYGLAYGAAGALLVWLILWLVAESRGDGILLSSVGAQELDRARAPQLWNILEEMSLASGLAPPPRLYLIDDPAPNAFAVGRPRHAAVAVTAGLLRRLNRDELQGVIGHEIGHIRNLDTRFLTTAGVMLGAIVLIADVFLRSLRYGSSRRSRSRGGGQAQLILLLVAIALAVLAPLVAQLLYLACSRRREYLADASSARYTRLPGALADALEKISGSAERWKRVNRSVAPMCTINPLQEGAVALWSTHPPTQKRVRILRSMGGAGLADYEAAFRQVEGPGARCIDVHTLAADQPAPQRAAASAPDSRSETIARAREVGDLLAGLASFAIIECSCGVRLKVPPDFQGDQARCPRCGRLHAVVPVAGPKRR